MSSFDELRKERLDKLNFLKEKGVDPYPSSLNRKHKISDIVSDFDSFQNKTACVAGRIMSLRKHGGSAFFDLYDGTALIQIYLKKDDAPAGIGEEQFKIFNEAIDRGDFVNIEGATFNTKKGEKTILAKSWKIISKSLRPLPENWYGFKDEEERLRKRYLDVLFNSGVKEMVEKKSLFWNSVREFLLSRGFLEVETPALEIVAGGADAKPFVTHHDALDMDVYLRISCGELWQKKLMVAGLEKVFEIGRIFRNEGMSAEHLQDYTQMEFYWGYANYKDGMDLVKELYRHIADKVFGTQKFKIKEFNIDLSKDWKEYKYAEIVKKYTSIDVFNTNLKEVESKLKELGVESGRKGKEKNLYRAIDALWKYCRKKIAGPGFLIDVPKELSPLAKINSKDKRTVERFQLIIAGSELGNGYSELNDPIDQAERFQKQNELREAGDEEAQMYDYDFVEALEYGMPPTCGFGMSERLFAFLMDKPIRETQIFPLMKPINQENKRS